MTIFHVAQSIAGCLRNNPVGTIDFLEDGNGNILSDAEARIELKKLLDKGQTLLPTSDDCNGFDAFGKGCPGHEPLAGSDLCRAMLKRGDKYIKCFMSNDEDAIGLDSTMRPQIVLNFFDDKFTTAVCRQYLYAIPINNMGEPLTAKEAGF